MVALKPGFAALIGFPSELTERCNKRSRKSVLSDPGCDEIGNVSRSLSHLLRHCRSARLLLSNSHSTQQALELPRRHCHGEPK